MYLRLPNRTLEDFDVCATSAEEAQERAAEGLAHYPLGTAITRVAKRPEGEIY